MISSDKQAELSKNFGVFQKLLPKLLPQHAGQYALMRHSRIVAFFDTAHDALSEGRSKFDDDLFSVQEITDRVVDFGWLSRAPGQPPL